MLRITLLLLSIVIISILFGCNSGKIDESKPERGSASSSSSLSAPSSSEKSVILRKEPYSGNENNIVSSSSVINKENDVTSSKPNNNYTVDETTKQMYSLQSYLMHNLSDYDYNGFKMDKENNTYTIFVTNKENVMNVVEKFKKVSFTINYEKIEYSRGYLRDIINELNQNPLISEHRDIVKASVVQKDNIKIILEKEYPELSDWIQQSKYKDIIVFSTEPYQVKTNPS